MQFGPSVALFDFSGIPMAANLSTGFVVGLTPAGAALCQQLAKEDVPAEKARAIDATLMDYLDRAGFFAAEPIAPSLRSAYLHVTQRCNLQCAGCYSLDSSRNTTQDASTDVLIHAIDQLATTGVASLFISGGEPFLRSDLPLLTREARTRGIAKITVITNGTCIDEAALREMVPFVDAISVSFDGYSADAPAPIRGTQRFDRLVAAVRAIQAAGIHAHIIPTIHRNNVTDLARYVALAESLDATMNYSLLSCEFSSEEPLAHLIPDEEALCTLADELLKLGDTPMLSGAPVGLNLAARRSCGAGCTEISVGADGTVYPCHMLQRPEHAMGNVFKEDLDAILRSDLANRLTTLDTTHIEGCASCRHRLLCGGGCRARSVYASENLESRDPYCAFMLRYYDQLGEALAAQLTRSV